MSLDLNAIRAAADIVTEARNTGYGTVMHADIDALTDAAYLAIAEVERLRAELRDARNDLLDVRGVLSPNGEPAKTPVPLVPTVAPAVAWLVAEAERVRDLADALADLVRLHDTPADWAETQEAYDRARDVLKRQPPRVGDSADGGEPA